MTTGDGIVVAPVTSERWSDLEELFERPGPRGGAPMPSSCWCMWWRHRTGDATENEDALRAMVQQDDVPGLLAYREARPVGWVSVADRDTFGQLLRSRYLKPEPGDRARVFAITCFYVDPREKRSGVATALARAAVEWAAACGAEAVEAYPLISGDYMGTPSMFEELGFVEQRQGGKRVLMRLVGPPAGGGRTS